MPLYTMGKGVEFFGNECMQKFENKQTEICGRGINR